MTAGNNFQRKSLFQQVRVDVNEAILTLGEELDTETHNCQGLEKKTVECLLLSGTRVPHIILPMFRNLCRRQKECESQRLLMTTKRGVFGAQLDSCTCGLMVIVTAW